LIWEADMSEPAGRDAVWAGELPRQSNGAAPLRLVADGGSLVADVTAAPARVLPERTRAAQNRMVRPDRASGSALRPHGAPHTPVRFTRPGRAVITAAAVLTIGALSMALAGAAEATGHSGASATPGRGVTKVVIRAGESLWSVAEAHDPNADTRLVIAEILQLNSVKSDQVQPGQVLWVPRG
jgi:nucleoid-associated protein YgaU